MDEYNQDVSPKKLTVRDILAINRTVLANERTFLAYLRTSATFLLAGISLVKFFNSVPAQVVGFSFITGAVIVGTYGVVKYDSMKQLILEEENVRHAQEMSGHHDNAMLYVPRAMWDMLHRAYLRLNHLEKQG